MASWSTRHAGIPTGGSVAWWGTITAGHQGAIYMNQASPTVTIGGGTLSTGAIFTRGVSCNGTRRTVYVNGSAVVTDAADQSNLIVKLLGGYIGRDGGTYFNGKLAEHAQFTSALSADDMANLHTYATGRYTGL